MLITKCDVCKKEVKDPRQGVGAGLGFDRFSFCGRCGKPVAAFLKKHKLLSEKKPVIAR